jgi:hypothetical protein
MLPALVKQPSDSSKRKGTTAHALSDAGVKRKGSQKLDVINASPSPADKKTMGYVADLKSTIFARDCCGVRANSGATLKFEPESKTDPGAVDALAEIENVIWGVERRFANNRPVRVFFGGKTGGEQLTWVEGHITSKMGVERETKERLYAVNFDFDDVGGCIVDQNVQTVFQTWLKTKTDTFSNPMLMAPMEIRLQLPGQHSTRPFMGTVRAGAALQPGATHRKFKISFTEPVGRIKLVEGIKQNFSGIVTVEASSKAELGGRELPVLTLRKTVVPVSENMLCPQPILVVGPVGSGKTTLLVQYALQLCEQQGGKDCMVPVLVPAAELATLMRTQKLGPDSDVLKFFFKQSCAAHNKLLTQLRGFRRLIGQYTLYSYTVLMHYTHALYTQVSIHCTHAPYDLHYIPTGQYGVGFKQGSMRVASTVVILTKHKDEISIGIICNRPFEEREEMFVFKHATLLYPR